MYLFPNTFKKPSAWIFYSSVVLGSCKLFFYDSIFHLTTGLEMKVPVFFSDHLLSGGQFWIKNNLMDEIISLLLVISGIIHGFSKERIEDELIAKIRLESLAWSVQINFMFVIMETVFIFGIHFYEVMIIQLFLILLLFNLKQHIALNRFYKQSDEK
jgi:hypothetical protein